jgi:hypothetical protein
MQKEFLKFLPGPLKREILYEYKNRVSDLKYTLGKKLDTYWEKDIEILEELLFLGIFYRRIIAPIYGTSQFSYTLIRDLKMNGLKIGSRKLSETETDKLYHIYKKFKSILNEYNLPIELFEYDTTEEFLNNVQKIKELE